MMNPCPVVASKQNELQNSLEAIKENEEENLRIVEKIFSDNEGGDALAMWGNIIDNANFSFIRENVLKIYEISTKYNIHWVQYGDSTRAGNPRHLSWLARKKNDPTYFVIQDLKMKY